MACVPIEQSAFELGPRDYLNHYLHIISTLRGGVRYLPLLLSKAHDTLPHIAGSSMLKTLPSSVEGQFESVSEESVNGSPDFEYEDPLASPMYKSEYTHRFEDTGESFLLSGEPFSPLSASFSTTDASMPV